MKTSVIFRPMRMVSTDSVILLTYFKSSSSRSPTIQSISPFGPAMQPSTDICTCNLNFLNTLLLFAICIIEYFIDLVDKHQLEDANILITKIFEARRRL